MNADNLSLVLALPCLIALFFFLPFQKCHSSNKASVYQEAKTDG